MPENTISSKSSKQTPLFYRRYLPVATLITVIVLALFLSCYFGNSNYRNVMDKNVCALSGGAGGFLLVLAVGGFVIKRLDKARSQKAPIEAAPTEPEAAPTEPEAVPTEPEAVPTEPEMSAFEVRMKLVRVHLSAKRSGLLDDQETLTRAKEIAKITFALQLPQEEGEECIDEVIIAAHYLEMAQRSPGLTKLSEFAKKA